MGEREGREKKFLYFSAPGWSENWKKERRKNFSFGWSVRVLGGVVIILPGLITSLLSCSALLQGDGRTVHFPTKHRKACYTNSFSGTTVVDLFILHYHNQMLLTVFWFQHTIVHCVCGRNITIQQPQTLWATSLLILCQSPAINSSVDAPQTMPIPHPHPLRTPLSSRATPEVAMRTAQMHLCVLKAELFHHERL